MGRDIQNARTIADALRTASDAAALAPVLIPLVKRVPSLLDENARLSARIVELEAADEEDARLELEEKAARAQGEGETAYWLLAGGSEARRIGRLIRALPGSPS